MLPSLKTDLTTITLSQLVFPSEVNYHLIFPVNKNIFVILLVYLDVIQIKVFDIDYVIKKVVLKIFCIDLSYFNHVYTNLIIGMEYIYSANFINILSRARRRVQSILYFVLLISFVKEDHHLN